MEMSTRDCWAPVRERGGEGFNRQVGGGAGSGRQFSQNTEQMAFPDEFHLVETASFGQFSQRRPTSDDRNAALGLKSNLGQVAVSNADRKLEHVAAHRIFALGNGVGTS